MDKNETKQRFDDTPSGWASRWAAEFEGEDKEHKEWRAKGETIEDRYLEDSALNLFYGDVETKKSLLYGNPPVVRSRRRFADPDDDVGRVAALMQERILNADVQRRKDAFRRALAKARDDRLLPGLGVVRFRYVAEMEDVPEVPAQVDETGNELAPAVPATQRKRFETIETDHINWRDFKWSPARCWDEVNWIAFRAEMTREQLHERFDATISDDAAQGPHLVDQIPLNAKQQDRDDKLEDPWQRAAVWEIWCKEEREVFWYVEGHGIILDRKPDPLGLDDFWPCPEPLFANPVSKKWVPRPDYAIHQHLYESVSQIQSQRQALIGALRVAGLYDGTQDEIKKLVTEKGNKLYPVQNMAALVEKGGVNTAILWMPLKEIVEAIAVLTEKLREAIMLKDQAVGIADVMRGQGTPGGGVTATERRIQARSASTRQRAAQDEFAGFATDAQNVRAEIIAKWFDPQTIVSLSNVERTKDAPLAQKGAELIKSEWSQFRIEVAADTIAMTDYDAVQSERLGVVQGIGGLLQASLPLVQMGGPMAAEFVLELASWLMAGTQGGASLEGTFDRFRAQAQQAAQAPKPPPPPDPKVQAAQVKAGAEQFKAKADMAKTGMDLQVAKEKHGMEMQKIQAQTQQQMIKTIAPPPDRQGPPELMDGGRA